MKKLLFAVMTALMLLAAATVSAATLTTADGVLSIETPDNENWVQVNDQNHWVTITNGNDTVTIDHLSNGEKLPEVQIADGNYAAVYQAYVSTKNEVFIVKALASDTQDLETLMKIIGTIKVLKYDTKTAIQTAAPAAQTSETGVRAINATYYCTGSDVNVRSGCSTDDAKIGSLSLGQEVYVVGAVMKNGQDTGWYQINYNGGTGYVSSAFLSASKPASAPAGKPAAATATPTPAPGADQAKPVGDPIAVYDEYGNPRGSIYEYSDGSFRDQNGKKVDYQRNGVYYNGSEYLYTSRHFNDEEGVKVYDEFGESYMLYRGSDGYWRDDSGTVYTRVSDSEFQVREGTKRLSVYYPDQDDDDDDEPYQLNSGFTCYDSNGNVQGMLRPYSDGLYYSNDMVAYVDQGNGSYYSSAVGEVLYDYNPVYEEPEDAYESDGSYIYDEDDEEEDYWD